MAIPSCVRKSVNNQHHGIGFLFLFVLVVIIATITLLASVPPISRDALTHHLYVPKLYIGHGGVYEIPPLLYSYYPMNLEMLYTVPLLLGNDVIPKYIHFLFAISTAWLIWRYLKERVSYYYAALGTIFFLTIPIIVKLSITAYVDLGLVFFSTASMMYLFKWAEQPSHWKYLLVSAVSCGLMIGTKYNGLIGFFLITLFIPIVYLRGATNRRALKGIGCAALFGIIALFIFSPWMVRNYLWTGNPIYPLYDQVFNQSSSNLAAGPSHFTIRHINYDESWWQIALIPFRIFFHGEDGNPKYFDGRLNPLLLILPIFAFTCRESVPAFELEKKILVSFSALFILFAFFQRDMRIRYVAPVIPPLVILSVIGFYHIFERLGRIKNTKIIKLLCACFLAVAILLFSSNFLYIKNQFQYVKPIGYLMGRVEREDYIEQYRHEYPVIQFANENLPESARILSLFLGNRGYYSDREMLFNETLLQKSLVINEETEAILYDLRSLGITHLLVRSDLFGKWINDNLDTANIEKLAAFMRRHTRLSFSENGYFLFSLNSVPFRRDQPYE